MEDLSKYVHKERASRDDAIIPTRLIISSQHNLENIWPGNWKIFWFEIEKYLTEHKLYEPIEAETTHTDTRHLHHEPFFPSGFYSIYQTLFQMIKTRVTTIQ